MGNVVDNRADNIEWLPIYAMGLDYEVGFVAKQYDEGGPYCLSDKISQNSDTQVEFNGLTPSVVAIFHTHPEGNPENPNLTGPSPGDFLSTVSMVNLTKKEGDGVASYGFKDSYIYAHDGSQYVLHVEDAVKAKAYFDNNPNLFSDAGLSTNKGSFEQGSALKVRYDKFYSEVKDRLGEIGAHDYAMANIMKEAGISLLKKDAGGDNFKQMDAVKTEVSGKAYYTLTKCKG